MTTQNPGRNVLREEGVNAAGKAWGAETPGLGSMDVAGEGLQGSGASLCREQGAWGRAGGNVDPWSFVLFCVEWEMNVGRRNDMQEREGLIVATKTLTFRVWDPGQKQRVAGAAPRLDRRVEPLCRHQCSRCVGGVMFGRTGSYVRHRSPQGSLPRLTSPLIS